MSVSLRLTEKPPSPENKEDSDRITTGLISLSNGMQPVSNVLDYQESPYKKLSPRLGCFRRLSREDSQSPTPLPGRLASSQMTALAPRSLPAEQYVEPFSLTTLASPVVPQVHTPPAKDGILRKVVYSLTFVDSHFLTPMQIDTPPTSLEQNVSDVFMSTADEEQDELLDRVHHILVNTFKKWETKVGKTANDNLEDRILEVPAIHKAVCYGIHPDTKARLEGEILLIPGQQQVEKIRVGYSDDSIYATEIGQINDFDEGMAEIWYGINGTIYFRSLEGNDWGQVEDKWRVYEVEGGYDLRSLREHAPMYPYKHFRKQEV
jgi:hypothetical protein